jgi:hypothetical protein
MSTFVLSTINITLTSFCANANSIRCVENKFGHLCSKRENLDFTQPAKHALVPRGNEDCFQKAIDGSTFVHVCVLTKWLVLFGV